MTGFTPRRRLIHEEGAGLEGIAVSVDENRAAVRVLTKLLQGFDVASSFANRESCEDDTSAISSCEPLRRHDSPTILKLNGELWSLVDELIIDKRVPEYSRVWTPGVHIVVRLTNDRGLIADVKGGLTAFSRRNTAEQTVYEGGYWFFDLWVRDQKAPVSACATSICKGTRTRIFGNLDSLGEDWTAEDVMKGNCSEWLNLAYRLTPSEAVITPNARVDFTFEVLDGLTHQRATDVSWDGYIIEEIDGYVPHKRLKVTKGIGTFRAHALMLEDGDTLRVKVRNRYVSSMAEASVKVRLPQPAKS